MENNPLRGLFGVSSPRPKPQLVAPQPTTPTENIEYEIPYGMVEQLLANPYAKDGTKHPDMHLIYVDEIYGLFKLAGLLGDEVKKKVFPLSLGEKHNRLIPVLSSGERGSGVAHMARCAVGGSFRRRPPV